MGRAITQLSRDPFARETLIRRRVQIVGQDCKWCGKVHITKAGVKFLYEYGIERDGSSTAAWENKLFCSKECRDSYRG